MVSSSDRVHTITSNRTICYNNKIYQETSHNMAQRSITSFFKKTPFTPMEIKSNGGSKVSHVNGDTSPISDEKDKPSERQQSNSIDNDGDSQDSLKPKNKAKRQRVISSSSESESPVKVKKEDLSDNDDSITLNKSVNKTYDSPKNKKAKIKKEIKSPSPKKGAKSLSRDEVKENSLKLKIVGSKEKDNIVKNTEHIDNIENESEEIQKVAENAYNPSKSKYHPIKDACWSKGDPVPYLALAKTLDLIEGTSARLKIIEILSNFYRSVMVLTSEDLLPCIYLCLNQLAPAYHSLELGIAETYLMKAIGQCTGRTLAQVKSAVQKCGDMGRVAEQARAAQKTMFAAPKLQIRKVFAALKEIAHMTGQASVNKKINKIQSLYVACRDCEARFLIRSLEGKLRIGLAEQSVLHALALAVATTPPGPNLQLDAAQHMSADKFKALVEQHVAVVRRTYCECPDWAELLHELLRGGVAALASRCSMRVGVPLRPMLAHPTRAVRDVLARFENEEFTCEYKYDGERAQIHVPAAPDDKPDFANAAIFSRNQENNTAKYPDVLSRLPTLLKEGVSSCVLDCEAVAFDAANGKLLPFQVLSSRKRACASAEDVRVPVCVFVFDLLYLNGAPLVGSTLAHRRKLLREHFRTQPGTWQFATSKDCSTIEEVQLFLEEAVKESCEGLMVKMLTGDNSKYDIARRSHNWLKLKKDYLEGVGDTVDAVIIGAYRGKGKRAGVYGGFLVACYDPESEQFQSLCKLGTGFSDEDLQALSDMLKEHIIDSPRNYYNYDSSHSADVWTSAAVVVEVRCADLSLSPAHRAAIARLHPHKGVSLRFPRFVRVREDKAAEQATTAAQVAQLYLAQDQIKNQVKQPDAAHEDDFY
ncbi:DNA ligase 1 isoform X2 [Bombyx mori]|uniref:DNA ligase n=1 Tax=Bombyx mori TaxID=7091 RepID=A0A8R2R7I5_BOMMO|nr:DNA ligase 1 isoform X2 [Bombyx mori]